MFTDTGLMLFYAGFMTTIAYGLYMISDTDLSSLKKLQKHRSQLLRLVPVQPILQ